MGAPGTRGYCPRAARLLPNNCPSTVTYLARGRARRAFLAGYPETRQLNHPDLTAVGAPLTTRRRRGSESDPRGELAPPSLGASRSGQLARPWPGSGRGHLRPPSRLTQEVSMSSPARTTVVDQLEQEWPPLVQHRLTSAFTRWRFAQPSLRRFEQPSQLLLLPPHRAVRRYRRAAARAPDPCPGRHGRRPLRPAGRTACAEGAGAAPRPTTRPAR